MRGTGAHPFLFGFGRGQGQEFLRFFFDMPEFLFASAENSATFIVVTALCSRHTERQPLKNTPEKALR